MGPSHLVFLVEEPSMEAFLQVLLPRVLPAGCTFEIHVHGGKADLLRKLESRLRGYARFLPEHWRIVVVVDRDDDDCHDLKKRLERSAAVARLTTRRTAGGTARWQVVTRIAIEELESWYFGDWEAVSAAFSGVPRSVIRGARFRDPDGIAGGTWEAFEAVLRRHGHFRGGLRKIEAARAVAGHINPARNTSPSFRHFYAAVIEATGGAPAP